MKLLEELYPLMEKDMSELPQATISLIKKKIRIGAADITQKWANALHLLHKAYKVCNVDRPSPDERKAWKQYEDLITFSVEELSRCRGIDGSWRMTAAMFESEEPKTHLEFHVYWVTGKDKEYVGTVEGRSMDEVVNGLAKDYKGHSTEIEIKPEEDGTYITIKRFGVKQKRRLLVSPSET